MYNEDTELNDMKQPSSKKWYKIVLLIGTILIGLSFVLFSFFPIVSLISQYVEISIIIFEIAAIGLTIFNYLTILAILLLAIGYIGLALATEGVGKITLIIGAVISIIFELFTIVMIIVNFILRPDGPMTLSYAKMLGILGYSQLMFKFLLISITFIIVTFSKGELQNDKTEYKLFSVSPFILPLWIILMIVGFVLAMVGIFIEIFSIIFFASMIAFGLNQLVYAIEFSLKVSKI